MLLYCFDAEFLRHGEIIPAKKKTNVSLFFSGVDSDYWSKKKNTLFGVGLRQPNYILRVALYEKVQLTEV